MAEHSILARPGVHQSAAYPVGPGARLELAFNQDEADLSREGQDLVFTFADGGTVILEDFYNNFGEAAQSPTLIVQGAAFDGEAFLAAQGNPDLMPAAGPDGVPFIVGGGLYDSAQLGGVQGMSSLGKLGFDGMAPVAPEPRNVDGEDSLPAQLQTTTTTGLVSMPGEFTPPGGGITPPPPPPPPPPPTPINPLDYVARGVMYAPDPTAPPELHVGLLSVSGNSAALAGTAAPAPTLTFYDDQGNQTGAPAGYSYSNGEIVFTDPAKFGTFYCVVDQGTAHAYSMQLVIPQDGTTFASPDYNPNQHLLWGEWHAGESSLGTAYQVHSSDLNDTLRFAGTVTNSAINTGDGEDTVSISAEASVSTGLLFALASGVLGMSGGRIETGADNDSISINVTGTVEATDSMSMIATIRATGMDNGSIASGAGNDTIRIEATATAIVDGEDPQFDDMMGFTPVMAQVVCSSMNNSSIDTGTGNDSISIEAKANAITCGYADATAYGMYNSSIDTGTGDDTVRIEAGIPAVGMISPSTACGMQSSSIDTGTGNDSISIEAKAAITNEFNGRALASGMDGSSIKTGEGNDTIRIEAEAIGDNSYTEGIVNGSISAGAGNNSISITADSEKGVAIGIYNSTVALGNFDAAHPGADSAGSSNANRLDVSATGSNSANSTAVLNGAIYGTAGNDRVSLIGGVTNVGIQNIIDMGGGYDMLAVNTTLTTNYASLYNGGNFEHLQVYNAVAADSELAGQLALLDANWAHVSTYDVSDTLAMNGFAVADHTDYILKAGADGTDVLTTDIILTNDAHNYMSDDTISVGGIDSHTVDLGRGWDMMTVHGDVSGSTITASGSIGDSLAPDQDTAAHIDMKEISISGALSGSSITTGDGHDHVTIGGAVIDSAIHLGSGNDFLMLTGNVSGTLLDGGGNDTVSFHHASGGTATAHLGDILSLSGAAYDSLFDSGGGIAGGNSIKNFNSLLVDLHDQDTHNLDNLLDSFATFCGTDRIDHNQNALIIQGNSGDTVLDAGSLLGLAPAPDTDVHIDGVSGTFNHYVVDNHDLYIQQEIIIKTST